MSDLGCSLLRRSSLALTIVLLASAAIAQAQTQASCTFKLFQLNPSGKNLSPNGVNDYSTVVGQAAVDQGFTRFAGGGVTYYSVPNSASTYFTARNDSGINVGVYSTQSASTIAKGFMLKGSTFTSIVHPKAVVGTTLTGINKYNSIVGWYEDAGVGQHGFKRYSNGGFVNLNYPGSQYTLPTGINDSGTVAGWFSDSTGEHGFIYHNGQWAPFDFGANTTQVFGISNANKIVGVSTSNEPPTSFIYENNVFKVISYPNAFSTQVAGISANGIITGTIILNNSDPTSGRGFTAKCN
jgi:probable HAF family extracellular repeat protein